MIIFDKCTVKGGSWSTVYITNLYYFSNERVFRFTSSNHTPNLRGFRIVKLSKI